MSDRAQFILVEKGKATCYYLRWGSVGFPLCLLEGIEALRARAIHDYDQISEGEFYSSEAKSETVVDQDRRLLFFWCYTQEETGTYLDYILDAIRERWPGWEVRYAYRGQVDLAEYLSWEVNNEEQEDCPYATPPIQERPVLPEEAADFFDREAERSIGVGDERTFIYSDDTRRRMIEHASLLRRRTNEGSARRI